MRTQHPQRGLPLDGEHHARGTQTQTDWGRSKRREGRRTERAWVFVMLDDVEKLHCGLGQDSSPVVFQVVTCENEDG